MTDAKSEGPAVEKAIEWGEPGTGAVRHLRKAWGPGMPGPSSPESYPATLDDLTHALLALPVNARLKVLHGLGYWDCATEECMGSPATLLCAKCAAAPASALAAARAELATEREGARELKVVCRAVCDQYGFGDCDARPPHERNAISILKGILLRDQPAPPSSPVAPELRDFEGDGGLMPGDQWRDAVERALGIEPDPIEHTPSWAYECVLAKREIGNGVRNESGPVAPDPITRLVELAEATGKCVLANVREDYRYAPELRNNAGYLLAAVSQWRLAQVVAVAPEPAQENQDINQRAAWANPYWEDPPSAKKESDDGPEVRSDSDIRDGRGRAESDVHREAEPGGVPAASTDEPKGPPEVGSETPTGQQEEVKASSGEAAGDGVKCEYCNRLMCGALLDRDDPKQLRVCRHATRLERDFLVNRVSRLDSGLKMLESDRDAERTQKEALRVELEEARAALVRMTDRFNEEDDRAEEWKDTADNRLREITALRAENEGLKAKLLKFAEAWDGPTLDEREHDELTALAADVVAAAITQQPTEAAPVAKGEAPEHVHDNLMMGDQATCGPCNAKAEAPSEPAGWAPRQGDAVRRKYDGLLVQVLQYTPTGYVRYEKPDGSLGSDHIRSVEPAPQPPATTGGERPVMLGELVAALRGFGPEFGADTPVIGDGLDWLADELERRKP